MSKRPVSSRPGSSSSSTEVGLHIYHPLPGAARSAGGLPEEWTLPHEWKIEKRELFDNWKMDVQNQIANIASHLNQSLQHHPHPEIGQRFDYSDKILIAEMEKRKKMESTAEGGNSLLYGLAKIPHTQQF